MSRLADAPCDWEGCNCRPSQGYVLYRVNPKGEPGVFMCREHHDAVWHEAVLL